MTVTCDQPLGFQLCERYMARQTYPGHVQWIVVDDGVRPITPTRGQTYVRRQREADCTGAQSLCRNLLAALPHIAGPVVAVVEHDDWYAPTHLAQLVGQLAAHPAAQLVGDDEQRYYHVTQRRWRTFDNRGASLCQTAFRASELARFEQVLQTQLSRDHYGVDGHFWALTPREAWHLERSHTCVGIKGLPGRPGLGIGHRPTGKGWAPDPRGEELRSWIGADAETYLRLRRAA